MVFCRKTRSLDDRLNRLCLPAVVFLAGLAAGCGNSCYTFVSNPGGGISTGSFSSPCVAATPTAKARVSAQVAQQCESCSQSNQIQMLVIRLRGVQLHRSVGAAGPGPDWLDLYPQLKIQPQQFELTGITHGTPGAIVLGNMEAIPADRYDLVRLQFATSRETAPALDTDQQVCGGVGANCVVMGDGRILPLVLDGDAVEFRIAREGQTSGELLAVPDTENQLLIDLTPVWSLGVSSTSGLPARLVVVLKGSARTLGG